MLIKLQNGGVAFKDATPPQLMSKIRIQYRIFLWESIIFNELLKDSCGKESLRKAALLINQPYPVLF